MARTISDIAQNITEGLQSKFPLSFSSVAEWRLWTNLVATAIHTFELILDRFKAEVENTVMTARPGTLKWYTELCFLFQNGHELVFDETTARVNYPVDDPAARITAVAAVREGEGQIVFKVAKRQGAEIVPFGDVERLNFANYINEVKFAGTRTSVVSTAADEVLYDVTLYYDPAYPVELVQERAEAALEAFKTGQMFGGILYSGRFVDALQQVEGVVTVDLHSIKRKGATDGGYTDVGVRSELEAGYFNYDSGSEIEYVNSYEL